ncbi:unnamed protein product, partial [Mesorhabditis spiculigera]
MGNILRRRCPPEEQLETIACHVNFYKKTLEGLPGRRQTAHRQSLMLIVFLTTTTLAWLILHFPEKSRTLLSVFPAVIGLLLLWLLRKMVNSYYNYTVGKTQRALDWAMHKKDETLEEIRETKTFKVACELLEKYDDAEPHSAAKASKTTSTTDIRTEIPATTPQGVHRGASGRRVAVSTPIRRQAPLPIRPMVRQPPSIVERFIDYCLGEGPGTRNALICSLCHTHNGMALPSEFDYLAFRCFSCNHLNPARKLRPSQQSSAKPLQARPASTPSSLTILPGAREITSQAVDGDQRSSTDKTPELDELSSKSEELEPVVSTEEVSRA